MTCFLPPTYHLIRQWLQDLKPLMELHMKDHRCNYTRLAIIMCNSKFLSQSKVEMLLHEQNKHPRVFDMRHGLVLLSDWII